MLPNFFISRPIFAMVIAIAIIVAGAVAIPILPIAQFPEITPPTVQVSASYTGADAETVEKTVTTPIEQQVNGVENMIYMSSTSGNDGTMTLTVSFEVGADIDMAQVNVQNRVQWANNQLPLQVLREGITTKKQSPNLLLVVNLISPDGTFDDLFLSNYADIYLSDVLKRIPGVGDLTIFGERKYNMRIWLDPDKLASLGLAATDVANAVKQQNLQVAAGQIGQPPAPPGQQFQFTITTQGRLSKVSEFENIIVRTRPDGSVLRVKDVARVELGAQTYNSFSRLNSISTIPLAIFQLPGANALEVARQVRAQMKKLSQRFPKGMEYKIIYDTTLFVSESIKEVVKTLFEAMLLVILVTFIFLQDWRTTLIPLITIPVSLIGTFALMMALGFSINTLTLFGLVLAVGLVVDDAIIVVEGVMSSIEAKAMSPLDAAREAMAGLSGPIIATSLVLMAVFIPVSFMPGITGQFYRQFALTIACSVGISTINALTLSPALCALLLRPGAKQHGWFFTKFNQGFDRFTQGYLRVARLVTWRWQIVMLIFFVLIGVTYIMFKVVPMGFIPAEDQGYIIVNIQGPEGSSLERTGKVLEDVTKILRVTPGVADVFAVGGYNLLTSSYNSNAAVAWTILEPWDKRTTSELHVDSILAKLRRQFAGINEAFVTAFNPPAIPGLGVTGGFEFQLQDLGAGKLETLAKVTQTMVQKGNQGPELVDLFSTFRTNVPQLYVDLDRTKAQTLGIPISDVFDTMQAYLGSLYVNDFNKFGRVYRVYLQAQEDYRSDPGDISRLYLRTGRDEMVPLSTLVKIHPRVGPQTITHFNMFRAAQINGDAAPGFSSGEAIEAMKKLAAAILPQGMGFEWSGITYQELKAGGMAPLIFGLALLFVFLFLAAQYESWAMPFMVMLVVPLAMLGALMGQWTRGLANDIYCQIGLVMLIGLASKNAILIVEYARRRHEEGLSIQEAALEAAHTRLRPVLMTAFSFILGVVPLVIASGAGAASRHSLGTAVFGGMFVSTFLSLGVVPVLYVVIERLREGRFGPRSVEPTPAPATDTKDSEKPPDTR